MTHHSPSDGKIQFSLREFLVVSLLVGLLIGLAGPFVIDLIRSGARAPQTPGPRPTPAVHAEPSAYFESGETPLQ